MRNHYKIEQELWREVESLATTPETIKYRLERAYEYHLSYVDHSRLPTDKMQNKLFEIQNQLTKNHTQSVKQTIAKWRINKCHSIAGNICDIYYEYAHFEWHLLPADTPDFQLLEQRINKTA